MEGIPALILWEQVIEVLCPQKKDNKNTKRNDSSSQHWSNKIDYVPANIPEPSYRAKLLILDDNAAVIKMTVKGRSPALRHVPRTHRIDLDWLFERIREDPSIDIRYVNTKLQIEDFLTKGHSTSAQWVSLCDMASSVPDQLKGTIAGRKSERKAPLAKDSEEVPENENKKKKNKDRAERKLGVIARIKNNQQTNLEKTKRLSCQSKEGRAKRKLGLVANVVDSLTKTLSSCSKQEIPPHRLLKNQKEKRAKQSKKRRAVLERTKA